MATTQVKQIVDALKNAFDPRFEKIDQQFEKIENKLEALDEKIHLLPTRQEFYDKMDDTMTELQEARDERVIMRGQIDEHEEKIEILETRLKILQK